MPNKIGVGIIGASAGRSWAARAHIPAIQASPDFALRAVSTSRRESADQASAAFGVPAFDDYRALVAYPGVDLVVVAVKVPNHAPLVRAAIESGKPIFCEWPLGNGLAETEQLAAEADAARVPNFIGLQARSSPGIHHIRQLLRDGYVGEVLSASIIGSGGGWGADVSPEDAYTLDHTKGASMLMIPFGHTLDASLYCLGEPAHFVSAKATRRRSATESGTGNSVPITVADQIALAARLQSEAILSMHFRGGLSAGTNFLWEINGVEGDLLITAASGQIQMNDLTVQGARKAGPLAQLPTPAECRWAPHATPEGFPLNVAQAYALIAQDLRDAGRRAPTFQDALLRHRTLDSIERSSQSA